jgi:26S proteasome regulatory subunit N8
MAVSNPVTEVVVHPLVLLSTVDHYNRVLGDTKGVRGKYRVVGVLLGTSSKGTVDVTNSFAVPFEEDVKNPGIFFLDHNYLDTMFKMYKKVNAREQIMGFYSSGPKIKESDIKIDELMRRFCPNPVFVLIDVRPDVEGIPTTAYMSVEEVETDGKEIQRSFKHIPSSVGAFEAEEVGVEHLVRDVNDPSVSSLANQIKHKTAALSGLKTQLLDMKAYLENVLAGKLPANNQIIYNMQTVFNLMPNLNVEELVRSLLVKTNDMHLVIYISSLIRCVISLHDLVRNKLQYKDDDPWTEKDKDENEDSKKAETDSSKDKDQPKDTPTKAKESPTKKN